jgi:hypothetical protein
LTLIISRRKPLIFLCTEAWTPYPLGDQEKWPSEGSLNYNTILQLDLFCKREEKWTEVSYIQLFFYLQDHPEWLHSCYLDTQTLAVLCKPQDKHGGGGLKKPLISDKAPIPTAPSTTPHSASPSKPPQNLEPPNICSPFNKQLSDLREITKDLGSYTDAPNQYIQAFISVIYTCKLAWKDIMLLLNQTLSSLEKQRVLVQITQVGASVHLQQAPIPVSPGNEEINMPIPMGAQKVPLADPYWDQNDKRGEWH